MEETGGDDVEDGETLNSPFSHNDMSEEERQLKAKRIFQREFDKQLNELEKQITRHECSITLVKKYLHIIRCQLLLHDEEHKFIFSSGSYNFINTRKRAEKQNENNKSSATATHSEHTPHIKVESACGNNNKALEREVKSAASKTTPRIPKELHGESECHIRGKRFKKLQRFIVGNVSQWCPERQYQASAPYKWMLYVRGPREKPEISNFVTKVSIFLDPSYHPSNVVHITEPPFHLVRRGWGEFLVRVVIFFYLSRNKPLTIYHRLQLDRTQCGYQRGAPETMTDYWIYTDIPRNTVHVETVIPLDYKEDNLTINEDIDNTNRLLTLCSKESDQSFIKNRESNDSMCQSTHMSVTDLIRLVDLVITDHNYSLLHNLRQRIWNKPIQQAPPANPFKMLIDGKSGVSVLKSSAKRRASGVLPYNRNSHVAEYDKLFRMAAEKSNTLPCHQAVTFLLHRLPLVTDKAASDDYLRFHPYAAISIDQYHSWSIARQCAAQFYRSKMIKNVLFERDSVDASWTCKEIIIHARRHGYVPFQKIKLVQDGHIKKYVQISPKDSMYCRLGRKHKISQKIDTGKATTVLYNNKSENGSKVKKNKASLGKNNGHITTDVTNTVLSQGSRKEAMPISKCYDTSAMQKSYSASDVMRSNKPLKADVTKIHKSKRKKCGTQIKEENMLHNWRRLYMKPTLCEPKRVIEFISANDEDDEGWNDDPRDVDILSVYSTTDLGESLNEDILEMDKDRAHLCYFVRKSFKWLSLRHGPKTDHYTVSEILVAIAAELFMEDVFRRSLSVAWNHYDPKGKTPITIYLKDALMALRRRKQFDIFSNSGLGVICDTRQLDK